MQSSVARQPAHKGADESPMDIALHASELLLASAQIPHPEHDDDHNLHPEATQQDCYDFPTPPPLMHFPHCRLEITDFPGGQGKLEQIALPGPLVRTLLSRFERAAEQPHPRSASPSRPTATSPQPTTTTRSKRPTSSKPVRKPVQIQRHFDDADDWVFSRCLLADFTGLREDEAEAMSSRGRLCCWASVVLQPVEEQQPEGQGQEQGLGLWELRFVVHRIGVRDPATGWCECF